ncbi:MAG TPA: antitoxin [Candidatus Nanoarchaeia archaeon]|nr:antitoxin [Candidatus Nanoarchaeia archaeon]
MIKIIQSIVDLEDRENRVVNLVKAKHGFINKSDAINNIIRKYEELVLDNVLKPIMEEKKQY